MNTSLKIHKTSGDIVFQYQWLASLPDEARPGGLELLTTGVGSPTLVYDLVQGHHPRDWSLVHYAASRCVWGHSHINRPPDDAARREYVDYVVEAMRLGHREWCTLGTWDSLAARDVRNAMRSVLTDELTGVASCHGDMTLYNCLLPYDEPSRIIFIDPGNPRGLLCRELDEAKMMQSLDGWDEMYRDLPPCTRARPMPTRRVHYALLLSHYVRLLRHMRNDSHATFAVHRILDLTELLG